MSVFWVRSFLCVASIAAGEGGQSSLVGSPKATLSFLTALAAPAALSAEELLLPPRRLAGGDGDRPCALGAELGANSNCKAQMKPWDACSMVCAEPARAVGINTCAANQLVGGSFCLSDSSKVSIHKVQKVFGRLRLGFEPLRPRRLGASPPQELLLGALASTLMIPETEFTVFLTKVVPPAGRDNHTGKPCTHDLIQISFQVIVADAVQQTFQTATELTHPGSASRDRLVAGLRMKLGVGFDTDTVCTYYEREPFLFDDEIARGMDGRVITHQAIETQVEEEQVSLTMMVIILSSVIIVLLIICAVVAIRLRVRRKAVAEEAARHEAIWMEVVRRDSVDDDVHSACAIPKTETQRSITVQSIALNSYASSEAKNVFRVSEGTERRTSDAASTGIPTQDTETKEETTGTHTAVREASPLREERLTDVRERKEVPDEIQIRADGPPLSSECCAPTKQYSAAL
eukprot:TRINITY_DN26542_c0_g1_i1.p1 TRINITY_DN26542_c0_g1~~TRINITY_DN26542_c0_g1_i1.p1  ORF type:complete len:461 (-),score=66.87 TRINITY_DN26542_c0_g1_i1:85-1467(-)